MHSPPNWGVSTLKWCTSAAAKDAARIGVLVLLWYTLGTVLSFYNKFLVGKQTTLFKEPFPAPLFMSGVQFAMQHMLARSVFAAGIMQRAAEPLGWHDWAKIVAPNGACTGLDIGFSNMSLVFISISFYTMCKATVPLFLLAFAFIWGIERPTWRLGLVVLIITIGLVLLVSGETHFDPAGFSLVMVAACCAGLRFTLTQVFLHGHHDTAASGSPLEILEALTPVMSATVFILSLVWEHLWVVLPRSIFFASFQQSFMTLLLILMGAVLAFLLVWTEYQLIKETSALTFMIAGTCKEIVTVLAAVVFLGDSFTLINGVGLGVVISGVALFNVYKLQRIVKGKPGARGPSAAAGRGGAAAGDIQVVTAALSGEALEMQPLLSSTANGHHEGSRAGAGAGAGGGVGSGASSSPPKASALGARHNGTGPGAAGASGGHSKAVGRGTREEEELVLLLGDAADEETPARGQGLPR